MYRRTLLHGLGAGLPVGLAGCLGEENPGEDEPGESSPTIEGDERDLAPGEDGTIWVQVDNVGSVQISPLFDTEAVAIDYAEAEFSASPSGQDDSYPPYWNWSPPDATVEITVPVSVDGDADPGEYRYAVTAWHIDVERGIDRSRSDAVSVTEEFIISVTTN